MVWLLFGLGTLMAIVVPLGVLWLYQLDFFHAITRRCLGLLLLLIFRHISNCLILLQCRDRAAAPVDTHADSNTRLVRLLLAETQAEDQATAHSTQENESCTGVAVARRQCALQQSWRPDWIGQTSHIDLEKSQVLGESRERAEWHRKGPNARGGESRVDYWRYQ